MLDAIFELLDRLDRAQATTRFRIVATVIGVALVVTSCVLVLTGPGEFLPAAYQSNVISSTIIAVLEMFLETSGRWNYRCFRMLGT